MDLDHKQEEGVDVVFLPVTRLDADNVPEFKGALERLPLGDGALVVDLSDVAFIDSMGVGALLGRMRRQHEHGSMMRLCGVQSTVEAIFSILKLSRVFEIYDTRREAVCGTPVE